MTIVLVRESNRVLLGLKKRGLGEGKWNGFGGKVQKGETIEEAAVRELKEESDLQANWLKKVGILDFEFVKNPLRLNVHVFTTSSYEGKPKESEEMKPQWYPVNSIPYDKMWADDKYWFPLFLKGSKFYGNFKFFDNDTLLEYKLDEVEKFE
ncbi:oxidized purine nucleoside triphosphate hydrolase-like isoform X2 [Centruroides vittatus]